MSGDDFAIGLIAEGAEHCNLHDPHGAIVDGHHQTCHRRRRFHPKAGARRWAGLMR